MIRVILTPKIIQKMKSPSETTVYTPAVKRKLDNK